MKSPARCRPTPGWWTSARRRARRAARVPAPPRPPGRRRRHRQGRRPTRRAGAVQFEVNGRTVDIQAYTRFLRQLEASPWITDVTPVSAQTVVEKERPVTAFTIRATYQAGRLGLHPDGSPQPVGEVGHGISDFAEVDAAPPDPARGLVGYIGYTGAVHRRRSASQGLAARKAQVVAVRDTIARSTRPPTAPRRSSARGTVEDLRKRLDTLSRQPGAAAPAGAGAQRGAQPARRHLHPRARSAA